MMLPGVEIQRVLPCKGRGELQALIWGWPSPVSVKARTELPPLPHKPVYSPAAREEARRLMREAKRERINFGWRTKLNLCRVARGERPLSFDVWNRARDYLAFKLKERPDSSASGLSESSSSRAKASSSCGGRSARRSCPGEPRYDPAPEVVEPPRRHGSEGCHPKDSCRGPHPAMGPRAQPGISARAWLRFWVPPVELRGRDGKAMVCVVSEP